MSRQSSFLLFHEAKLEIIAVVRYENLGGTLSQNLSLIKYCFLSSTNLTPPIFLPSKSFKNKKKAQRKV